MELDDYDKQLLRLLQNDGKMSAKDLAAAVNLSLSPCWRRIRRLEKGGAIKGYTALLDRKQLGFHAQAYLHISLVDHSIETIASFDQLVQFEDRIIECASITGEDDYIIKVVARDPEDLERFIMERILRGGMVRSSKTNFVLSNKKTGAKLSVT